MDILEIMARGHSTHMAWVWDKMTETRRNVALTEMQAIVDALNMSGYCVVPIKSAP